MKILSSASKLVFLSITLTFCIAYLYGIFVGITSLDSKDFFALGLMVFTFYFANKGSGETNIESTTNSTTETKSIANEEPFLGK